MPEKVIIVIPTYNEALVIAETLHQVFHATQAVNDFSIEVLIFDSASTDNTYSIVQALTTTYSGKLHLQQEPQKTGLGSAYIQAMNYALNQLKADIVVEFDADLSHQPQYLVPILETLRQCDVVVGSRYIQGGSIPNNWGIHRKCLSILGNQIARWVLTRRYQDFTSGFRATRRQALLSILPEEFLSNHYAYKLHLLWLLHKDQAKIAEFPIQFVDRQFGQSKLPANSIKDALKVIFTLRYRALKQAFQSNNYIMRIMRK